MRSHRSGGTLATVGRRWWLAVAVVLALVPGRAVHAEATLAEARFEFDATDGLLDALYSKAAAELAAEALEDLRRDQRRWLAGRDPYATAVARLQGGAVEGAEEDDPWFWLARAERTTARSEVLRGWLAYFRDGSDTTEWEGVWVDGDGDTVGVAEVAAERVALQVFVVRGPAFHFGELAGVAERHGRTARKRTSTATTSGSGCRSPANARSSSCWRPLPADPASGCNAEDGLGRPAGGGVAVERVAREGREGDRPEHVLPGARTCVSSWTARSNEARSARAHAAAAVVATGAGVVGRAHRRPWDGGVRIVGRMPRDTKQPWWVEALGRWRSPVHQARRGIGR